MERNDSKSRVKFKDVESSQGPLISMPGLYGEDVNYPTEIIFSKHLSKHSGTYERDQEIGYVECMEHDVEQALENSLKMIRSTDGSEFDLVLYKEALHHATKISRILVCTVFHFTTFLHHSLYLYFIRLIMSMHFVLQNYQVQCQSLQDFHTFLCLH